jgi:hypothetical protein
VIQKAHISKKIPETDPTQKIIQTGDPKLQKIIERSTIIFQMFILLTLLVIG